MHDHTRYMIFQTDWNDFPRLFFYNTHNSYLIRLYPTYLELEKAQANPQLKEMYRDAGAIIFEIIE